MLGGPPLRKDDEYVDVHGRDLPTTVNDINGEVLVTLADLKQTGIAIYQSSQYAKLFTVDKKFDAAFDLFMLDCAKNYMLVNKILFPEDKILTSIDHCKKTLSGRDEARPQESVFKDRRVVQEKPNEILIEVPNASKLSPQPCNSNQSLKVEETTTQNPIATPEKDDPKLKFSTLIEVSNASKLSPQPCNSNQSFKVETTTQNPIATSEKGDPKLKFSTKDYLKKRLSTSVSTQPLSNGNEVAEKNSNTGLQQRLFFNREAKNSTKMESRHHLNGQQKEKFTYNTPQQEHNVIVTRVEKRNCVWVRDIANDDVFDNIIRKINKEAEFRTSAAKPWELGKVYMAEDKGCWFRCRIIRYRPLTVFFLDYGNVSEVDEIREVSEELAKTPCMAVRITFKESEYQPRLEDEIRIKIFMQNDDGTFFVNVFRDNLESATATPQPLHSLRDGQKVSIHHEHLGVFYLRTSESFEKLKRIEDAIENHVDGVESPQDVAVGRLVLCRGGDDAKFYRAAVEKNLKNKVDVTFVDYFKRATVNVTSLKATSPELSRMPATYFRGGKLARLQDKPFADVCNKFIQKAIDSKHTYTVVLNSDGGFDLSDDAGLLSEQLQELQRASGRKLKLADIQTDKPNIGISSYLCGSYKNSSDLYLLPTDALQTHMDFLVKAETEDDEAYSPEVGEVCRCLFFDGWYRCVVSKFLDPQYEVLLLDFGNVELMKKTDLRVAEEDIKKVPFLAFPCRLTNLPHHHKIEDALNRSITEGEIYNVDVKSLKDGKYYVEFPSVYKKIMEQL